jgi:hypothetical protein
MFLLSPGIGVGTLHLAGVDHLALNDVQPIPKIGVAPCWGLVLLHHVHVHSAFFPNSFTLISTNKRVCSEVLALRRSGALILGLIEALLLRSRVRPLCEVVTLFIGLVQKPLLGGSISLGLWLGVQSHELSLLNVLFWTWNSSLFYFLLNAICLRRPRELLPLRHKRIRTLWLTL